MTRYIAFCRIMELGSFTRAAESLGYTQAAISQMIRSLENEFSMTLLVRTRSGVKLTPEGKKLYPMIRKIVSDQRELTDRVREINGLESGEIRIGTFPSMSQRVLTRLMRDFSLLYPKARFVLQMGDNSTLPEWIKAGIIDFAFIYPEVAANLSQITLFRDSFAAAVPEEHPLARYEVIPLAEFSDVPLILVEEGSINTVLNALTPRGITPPIPYRIHDDYTILSMIEQGLGVSILPDMILDRSMYRMCRIPTDPPIKRTISLAYSDQAMLPVATKHFIRFLLEKLPEYMQEDYTEILYTPEEIKGFTDP